MNLYILYIMLYFYIEVYHLKKNCIQTNMKENDVYSYSFKYNKNKYK